MRNPKSDPCEWDNGQGKSKVALLTETIESLKARIIELENPGLTTPSVTLHDPYVVYKEKRLSHSPPLPEPSHMGPHSPFSPTSTTSSLPSGRHWNNLAALEAMTPSTGSSVSPSRQLLSVTPASSTEVRMEFTGEGVVYSLYTLQEPPRTLIPFLYVLLPLLNSISHSWFVELRNSSLTQ